MRYAMAAFPLVGVAIGFLVLLWGGLAAYCGVGPFLRGTGLALLPLLVAGGIHMDGFCDTVDALASHGDEERKRAILKDPHVGSFAAVAAAAYLLLFAALGSEMAAGSEGVLGLAPVFVLSRALAGLAVVRFPRAKRNGLASQFGDAAAQKAVTAFLALWLLIGCAAMPLGGGWPAGLSLVIASALFVMYRRMAMRQFGGNSGDLAGWFVQMCEIGMLAGLVVGQKLAAVV